MAAALPKLNGKHVVFGEIVSGFEILDLLEEIGSPLTAEGVPTTSAVVADCGLLEREPPAPEPAELRADVDVDVSVEVAAAGPEPEPE